MALGIVRLDLEDAEVSFERNRLAVRAENGTGDVLARFHKHSWTVLVLQGSSPAIIITRLNGHTGLRMTKLHK